MISERLLCLLSSALQDLLRIATPDLSSTDRGAHAGVRGCVATLQVLVNSPWLHRHSAGDLRELVDAIDQKWPGDAQACKPPRATEEPWSHFVVRWYSTPHRELMTRLAGAIARDYHRRWSAHAEPKVVRKPESYTLARACSLLLLGLEGLSVAPNGSDRDLVNVAFERLPNHRVGTARDYLKQLALGALKGSSRRPATKARVIAVDELEIEPAHEHFSTGTLAVLDETDLTQAGMSDFKGRARLTDLHGVSKMPRMSLHHAARLLTAAKASSDVAAEKLMSVGTWMLAAGQSAAWLVEHRDHVPRRFPALGYEGIQEAARCLRELSAKELGMEFRLNDFALVGEFELRSRFSPVELHGLVGRGPRQVCIDETYVHLISASTLERRLGTHLATLQAAVDDAAQRAGHGRFVVSAYAPAALIREFFTEFRADERLIETPEVHRIGRALGAARPTDPQLAWRVNRAYALFICVVTWGLRPFELAWLCPSSFDWTAGVVRLLRKSSFAIESGWLPFPRVIQSLLRPYLFSRELLDPAAPVFGSAAGSQLDDEFAAVVSVVLPKAGSKGLYAFRHHCVTMRDSWARSGNLPDWLLKIAIDGHSPWLMSQDCFIRVGEINERCERHWRALLPAVGVLGPTRWCRQ